jgi:hypothetical protein
MVKITQSAHPTIISYNATVVKFTTQQIAYRVFLIKNIFPYSKKL